MQGRWRKRPLSLTLRSKEKLPPPVLPRPPRTRQIHLWWPHLPKTLPLSHLRPLLPKSNPILHGWTSLPSWPATASWPVMSTRSVSKTICASIVVQETISWTSVPRSRPWSLPKAVMLQQLLILWQLPLRNPQKNRERPPGLCTDWGPRWTPLYSNESNSTQHIHSFWSSFTLCFPYFSLDPWSGSP